LLGGEAFLIRCIARRSSFLLLSILVWTTGLEAKIWADFGSDAWMSAGLVLETGWPFSRLSEFLLSFVFAV